jgi:hypothetical protein
VDSTITLGVIVGAIPLPDNLAPKVHRAEDRVEQHLEVMAGGRIAMQVEASGWLQHAAQLDQARSHHREIRQQVRVAEKCPERLHRLRGLPARLCDFLEGTCGFGVPLPGILERLDLRRSLRAVTLGEQDVVAGVGIERRIEVDEIDALIGDVSPEHVEVVAVIEQVIWHGPTGFYHRQLRGPCLP